MIVLATKKLSALAAAYGFDTVDAMLEETICDSVSPAICVRLQCSYTTDMEPDQQEGYCEVRGHQSVQSALVLAEMI